jgi:antitoxin (DNA-binding transcriptional repressor) of toxin-antitoxin stability system
MTVIPHGKLLKEIDAVLTRAERGERFTVTVAGRPVAELGPLPTRPLASPEGLQAILVETSCDPGFAEGLLQMREEERE